MKTIKLTISKSRLYEEVSRTTAYLGAKQAPAEDPGGHFDRLAVIDCDNPMLDRFVVEALSALAERLRGSVISSDTGSTPEATISLTLSLSDSYDDSLTLSAEGNFQTYMAAVLTARWLRLVAPEKEGVWLSESQRLLTEITAILYHRNPPKRII